MLSYLFVSGRLGKLLYRQGGACQLVGEPAMSESGAQQINCGASAMEVGCGCFHLVAEVVFEGFSL